MGAGTAAAQGEVIDMAGTHIFPASGASRLRCSRSTRHDKRLSSGQAMVEFAVALFAIVLIAAGIADFIAIASRRSEIAAPLRGRAGAAAMSASAFDAASLAPRGSIPRPVFSEASLTAGFVHRDAKEEVPLSRALRDWLYLGGKDSATVGCEVWMPPLEITSTGEGGGR